MTDTPSHPDVSTMTPAEASGALAQMQADAHPPAPLSPTTAAEATARLQTLTSNKEWGARLLAGHIEERQEWQRLTELAAGADEVKDATGGRSDFRGNARRQGNAPGNGGDQGAAERSARRRGLVCAIPGRRLDRGP